MSGADLSNPPLTVYLRHAFHDAQIALAGVGEYFQGGLVGWSIVAGCGCFHARELDDNDALQYSGFISFGRRAARQESTAGAFDCRSSELCVGRKPIRI